MLIFVNVSSDELEISLRVIVVHFRDLLVPVLLLYVNILFETVFLLLFITIVLIVVVCIAIKVEEGTDTCIDEVVGHQVASITPKQRSIRTKTCRIDAINESCLFLNLSQLSLINFLS